MGLHASIAVLSSSRSSVAAVAVIYYNNEFRKRIQSRLVSLVSPKGASYVCMHQIHNLGQLGVLTIRFYKAFHVSDPMSELIGSDN